jgi:hypothetical protein
MEHLENLCQKVLEDREVLLLDQVLVLISEYYRSTLSLPLISRLDGSDIGSTALSEIGQCAG